MCFFNRTFIGGLVLVLMLFTAPIQSYAQEGEEPRCSKVDLFIHTDPLAVPYPSDAPRILKWGVPPVDTDPHDGTYVYDVCLTYYAVFPFPVPPSPPCIQTTSPGPVEFDVFAGYRFDLQSSIVINGVLLVSEPSYCVIVTGGSDTNGDGITGGPDYWMFLQQFGRWHGEPF